MRDIENMLKRVVVAPAIVITEERKVGEKDEFFQVNEKMYNRFSVEELNRS
jgi:hypothetical protein